MILINLPYRSQVLAGLGANAAETEELLTYNHNIFDHALLQAAGVLPLPDEPFVAAWEEYFMEAQQEGVWNVLQRRLIQFQFPIRDGISQSEYYKAATLRQGATNNIPEATGLVLVQPDKIELRLHSTLAGRIPIIITRNREDFVAIVRALAHKNEPVAVPDSMGASVLNGYNNWDRILAHKRHWEKEQEGFLDEAKWQAEFRRLIPQKNLYQDRLIILSDGPYSSVPAQELAVPETEWRELSLIIRREHESTHYFTRRLLGAMRNHMLDELIADYMGIMAATSSYNARWFLRFAGLENYPIFREGGRLDNYRGNPALSDGAFRILQALVKNAAENLERFDRAIRLAEPQTDVAKRMLLVLTRLTLEELASGDATEFLSKLWNENP